jgi:hypothetical protein
VEKPARLGWHAPNKLLAGTAARDEGGSILYHNNGDDTSPTSLSKRAWVAGGCTGGCFVDYDRDGRLGLIVTRYVEWDFSSNVFCREHRPVIELTVIPIHQTPFLI